MKDFLCILLSYGILEAIVGHKQVGQLFTPIGAMVSQNGHQEVDVWQLIYLGSGQILLVLKLYLMCVKVQQVSYNAVYIILGL